MTSGEVDIILVVGSVILAIIVRLLDRRRKVDN
jgi:hypothetical protein